MGHASRLLTRDNATPLVHLEIPLLQPTRSVIGSSMHYLSARSNSLHLFSYELFLQVTKEVTKKTTDGLLHLGQSQFPQSKSVS